MKKKNYTDMTRKEKDAVLKKAADEFAKHFIEVFKELAEE